MGKSSLLGGLLRMSIVVEDHIRSLLSYDVFDKHSSVSVVVMATLC